MLVGSALPHLPSPPHPDTNRRMKVAVFKPADESGSFRLPCSLKVAPAIVNTGNCFLHRLKVSG